MEGARDAVWSEQGGDRDPESSGFRVKKKVSSPMINVPKTPK